MPDRLAWIFRKLLLGFFTCGSLGTYTEWPDKQQKKNFHGASDQQEMEMPYWWKKSEENGETDSDWREEYGNTSSHSLQPLWTEKHLGLHDTLNAEIGGLQQKTTSGSTPVS